MSKNNKKKKASAQPVKEKKPVKPIIIAAVAVLLAAAVIVAVVLVKKDNGGTPDNGEIVTMPDNGTQYTYAKYKTTAMPVEFVEILNQAEKDSAAACEKYGVALEIGERKISVPEFVMNYYDQHSRMVGSADYSIQQTGENRTGYDYEILPGEQKHIRHDYTWQEQFTLDAVEGMREVYYFFDKAVERKTEISVMTIAATIDSYEIVDERSGRLGITPDESLEEIYGPGVTEAMYKAREIMMAYAQQADIDMVAEKTDSYSEEDIEEKIKEKKHDYTMLVGRVYPIEGEYNEAEIAAVKNEEQFIAFAQKNFPFEDYDAELKTQCEYVMRSDVADVFGEETADWMFNDERKAGDIAVVSGMLFDYLCYIETPPYFATSRQIIYCDYEYMNNETAEDRQSIAKDAEAKYLEWKEKDGTKEGFAELSVSLYGNGEVTVRERDLYYEVGSWVFNSERKPGDSAFISYDTGYTIAYFVDYNNDDYDWKQYIRQDLSVEESTEENEKAQDRYYDVDSNDANMEKAYATANKCIEANIKRINERKENQES